MKHIFLIAAYVLIALPANASGWKECFVKARLVKIGWEDLNSSTRPAMIEIVSSKLERGQGQKDDPCFEKGEQMRVPIQTLQQEDLRLLQNNHLINLRYYSTVGTSENDATHRSTWTLVPRKY